MEKKELRQIIMETLNFDSMPSIIDSQIHRYKMELGLSYKEIARAFVYFFGVQKNEYKAAFGIGVLPNVVPEANAYYEKLKKQREEQLKSVEEAKKHSDIILEIKHIPTKRKRKLIEIENLVIEEDD